MGKFFKGDDLRFFFAGQLNDVWANLGPGVEAIPGGGGSSFSGRAISFGCDGGTLDTETGAWNCDGNPVFIANLQPVGGLGGFVELSFPLSRIFHADPEGRNAGWVFHTQYGTDRAKATDARKTDGLARTDLYNASLTYKMNSWVSFTNEVSYIVTRAATADQQEIRRQTGNSSTQLASGIRARLYVLVRIFTLSGPVRGRWESQPETVATAVCLIKPKFKNTITGGRNGA